MDLERAPTLQQPAEAFLVTDKPIPHTDQSVRQTTTMQSET